MARSSTARQDMLNSAIALQRQRGLHATAFADVLEHSGAPRGSVYHHFPGGKAQLAEEATRAAGAWISVWLERALNSDDPAQALDDFLHAWSASMTANGGVLGCPVAAGALDPDPGSGARRAARQAFESWHDALARVLTDRGVPYDRAKDLALLSVAAIEGAILLGRAADSVAPFDAVRSTLRGLISDALTSGSS